VAFALVLRSDAQNVRKRSYACESADAFAESRVGWNCNGSRSRPKAVNLIALHSIGKSRAAARIGYPFRVDINSAVGRKAGLSDEKLRAVPGNDLTPLNDTERLVIELADALTNTPSDVSDELYARLRNQFSEEQLMQLAAQIAFENYRARWNRLFIVESDNLYQGPTAS
jgi:hypothetical protein